MIGLALLLGWAFASVSLMLGYNLVPFLFLAATVATVLALRAFDRRRCG